MTSTKSTHGKVTSASASDEQRLLPMLIAGLVLIVIGMVAVMVFV